MSSTERGWYTDPAGAEATYRWWDGNAWTEWLSRDPDAAAPSASSEPPRPGEPAEPDEPADPDETAGPGESAEDVPPATDAPAPAAREYPPGYEPQVKTAGASPVRPRAMIIGAILVAIVVVVAIVIYGNRKPADDLSLPPTDSSASSSAASSASAGPNAVMLAAKTGKVSIGAFSATLPPTPYTYDGSVLNYPPMLETGVLATAPVDVSYDGKHTWFAAMYVGRLDNSVINDDDALATADSVYKNLNAVDFPDTKITVGKITTKSIKLAGTDRAATAVGQVHYSVKGVASKYDHVSVLVVKLTNGPWVGWMSSRPDKASTAVQNALQESINSIRTGS